MEQDEKLENQLQLALDLPVEERKKTQDLNVGYDENLKQWEIIFQYVGSLEQLNLPHGVEVEPLSEGYAIAFMKENLLETFSRLEQIIFIEKPKALLLSRQQGIAASCMLSIKNSPLNLSGEGVLIAVIDTGIDIFHPDFQNENGTTKIVSLWDQTIPGNPPAPFTIGTVYLQEEINQALQEGKGSSSVRSQDISGHGTHVASICGGRNGVAPMADFLIVKLGKENDFPRTTQLMMAVQYVVDFAKKQRKPLAVNISYGHNYGDHRGNSLLETFLSKIAGQWKSVFCIGTGNEGDSARHKQGVIQEKTEEILFDIAPAETSINLQIWKNFADEFELMLVSPSGKSYRMVNQPGKTEYLYADTKVVVYNGLPTPYNVRQEIYFVWIPQKEEIESGQWNLKITPVHLVNGEYQMWLPVSSGSNRQTRFLEPSKTLTLTIPSTADKVISVGAYNVRYRSYAEFSGRGDTSLCVAKPDLVAPGVGILGAAPGGGENRMSGTSMATPFVTGAAALMMEWGIIRGNDPYFYGERVKAYLHRGARKMPGFETYPNDEVGYASLCKTIF